MYWVGYKNWTIFGSSYLVYIITQKDDLHFFFKKSVVPKFCINFANC